jgi:prophage antirepressor-like protein|nr:MAG TPA: repressor domain protein [Bacteriophage sp.]
MDVIEKSFSNEEFSKLETIILEDGTVVFLLNDIVRILGLSNQSSLISRLSSQGVYKLHIKDYLGTYVDEGNLYSCIFQSRKPEAEKFRDWVTREVIPSIRKHGAYITGEKLEEVLSDPQKMIEILTDLVNERKLRKSAQKELEESKPKIEHYDRILSKNEMMTATMLSRSFGMTTQKLNKVLLKLGIIRKLSRGGSSYGFTYKYENEGYGNLKDIPVYNPDGTLRFYAKSLVFTEKGREFISNLLFDKELILSDGNGSVVQNDKKIKELLK